jgi:hypothetical protein
MPALAGNIPRVEISKSETAAKNLHYKDCDSNLAAIEYLEKIPDQFVNLSLEDFFNS